MLRNIGLVFILAVATADNCSKNCICSQNSAKCDSTNFTSFGEAIYKLKITNSKIPLIIKNGTFAVNGLQDVDTLSIEHATILDIDEAAISGIPKLSSFKIIDSNIPRINNPLTFANSKKLRILQISNSTLSNFDKFQSPSLEELDLSGNKLTKIFKSSFEFLPSLTFVNLEYNNISVVHPEAFSKLINLQDILLSGNNITHLPSNIFENNTELVSINLSKNPLKEISLNLVSDLEKLVLKSCQLKTFDERFSNSLQLLSYLDLSDNNINFTVNSFEKMEELEFIDLSNNGLTKLDSRIFFSNRKLQKIILDNNAFAPEFPKLESRNNFETYYFSCNNCSIEKLSEDAFKDFSSLVILNLSHNKLDGSNLNAIQNLNNLAEINLSYNNIKSLSPSTFTKSSALQRVNLAGNFLKIVNPNVFYLNRVLKYLDVSNCRLEKLWQLPVKRNMDSLAELNIESNLLASVSPRDLQIVPFVKVLGISNNLLQCDQVLRETITWLTKHEVLLYSSNTKTTINDINSQETELNLSSWRVLAKERCLDEFYFESSDGAENDILTDEKAPVENDIDDDDSEYPSNDEDYVRARELFDTIRFTKENRTKYSFLWPTLVFIFTALSVLVIAANVLLLILRTRAIPRHVNLPHIKIPRWNTNNRLKKHSGSVYQPLSEDKSEIFISNGNLIAPTHFPPKTSRN